MRRAEVLFDGRLGLDRGRSLETLTKLKQIPQPRGSRIVVRPHEAASVSEGGVILPDSAQETPTTGEIVRIGKDVEDLKVGETAIYSRYSGDEYDVEGTVYRIIRDSDVYATE